MSAYWESVRTDAGYHLRLKGRNGKIVLTSEVYEDYETCEEAIRLAKEADPTYQIKDERTTEPKTQTFMAKCRDCEELLGVTSNYDQRAWRVGQHRSTTGHTVDMWTEMK